METRTKLEAGVFILLLALTSGAYFIGQEDQAYYCEVKDIVGICDKLSSGLGTRCYFEDTYKTCSSGWQPLEGFQEAPEPTAVAFEVFANGEIYSCASSNFRVSSYLVCNSPTGKEGYLGELV